jgi:uracil-DNA glycosylase family 4
MSERDTLRRMLVQQLESLRGYGVQQLGSLPILSPAAPSVTPVTAPASQQASYNPPAERTPMPRKTATTSLPLVAPGGPSVKGLPYSAPLSRDERLDLFEKMKKEAAGCVACPALVSYRRQIVFGVGNVMPRVVFFGEAPGEDEDKKGEPFVGRAGKKLDQIIEACTFKREDVYILNVLKCRPPDNRPPEPQETANCRHYFERQLDALQPEYIVCLGASAAKALLETEESIGRLRGRFFEYRGSKVVATYHPSYLLRNPPASKYVWEDMKMMLADMGIVPPAAQKQ